MIKPDPPHTYKAQRLQEKQARLNRERLLSAGNMEIPPMCGYTYTPRRRKGETTKPADVSCPKVAGSNTNHQGSGYCDYHDWASKHDEKVSAPSQYNAALRVVHEKARFFGKSIVADPHTMILEEIGRTASIVIWLEDKLKELSDEGLPDDALLSQYSKAHGFTPSIWIELLQGERKHLVATCVAAIKAGVAERKVQIAETQGRMIAAMMMAFMHDPELGLSPEQMIAAPKLIRKHLLALPTAEAADLDPHKIMENATKPAFSGARAQALDV